MEVWVACDSRAAAFTDHVGIFPCLLLLCCFAAPVPRVPFSVPISPSFGSMGERTLESYLASRFGNFGDDDDIEDDDDDDQDDEDEFEAAFAGFSAPMIATTPHKTGPSTPSRVVSAPSLSPGARVVPSVVPTGAVGRPMVASGNKTPSKGAVVASPMSPIATSFSADALSPTADAHKRASQSPGSLGSTGSLHVGTPNSNSAGGGDPFSRRGTLRRAGVQTIATLSRITAKLRVGGKRDANEPVYGAFQPMASSSPDGIAPLSNSALSAYNKWAANRRMLPQRQTFFETVGTTINHNLFEVRFVSGKDDVSQPYMLEVCLSSLVVRAMDTGAFLREFPFHLVKSYACDISQLSLGDSYWY